MQRDVRMKIKLCFYVNNMAVKSLLLVLFGMHFIIIIIFFTEEDFHTLLLNISNYI